MPTESTAKTKSPRQRATYLDAKRRKAALDRMNRQATVDITTMRCALGIGRAVAYREAERFGGTLVGSRWIFPTSKLREFLGLPAQTAA